MAASLGDPRYGVSITVSNAEDKKITKSLQYLNFALHGNEGQYGPDKIYEFGTAVANLTGGTNPQVAIVAQYAIDYSPT